MSHPNYLVQTGDSVLHAYWDRTILSIHLIQHKGESVKLFKAVNQMGAIKYLPITEAEFRAEAKAAS